MNLHVGISFGEESCLLSCLTTFLAKRNLPGLQAKERSASIGTKRYAQLVHNNLVNKQGAVGVPQVPYVTLGIGSDVVT